jgi:hypothetical protein
MLEIVVRESGNLTVASYKRDGSLHRVDLYDSWPDLLRPWCTSWSIDNRRLVRVTSANRGGRHTFALAPSAQGDGAGE